MRAFAERLPAALTPWRSAAYRVQFTADPERRLAVVNGIKSILPRFKAQLPATVFLNTLYDRSQSIRASVSDVELTLGRTLIALAKYPQAVEHLRTAQRLAQDSAGAGSLTALQATSMLGQALRGAGKREQAVQVLRQGIAQAQRGDAQQQTMANDMRGWLAWTLRDQGRIAEAEHQRLLLAEHRPPRGQGIARLQPHPEEKTILATAPEVADYIAALKQRSRKVPGLVLRQLLRLVREYPRKPLLAAVAEAARYGLYDLDRLERMILRRVAREYFLLDEGSEPHDE